MCVYTAATVVLLSVYCTAGLYMAEARRAGKTTMENIFGKILALQMFHPFRVSALINDSTPEHTFGDKMDGAHASRTSSRAAAYSTTTSGDVRMVEKPLRTHNRWKTGSSIGPCRVHINFQFRNAI